jgi:SAM-dependent methyltransferase
MFDEPFYLEINEARWAVAAKILDQLGGLQSCLDAGCGPGWFAERLARHGLRVIGIDGRAHLVAEARRRVPNAMFGVADITDARQLSALPVVDLVFCFGLMYHLENPFAAIRAMRPLCGRYMLIETQVCPATGPMLQFVSEGVNDTQGLTHNSVIPSRIALVKMLYVSGFASAYRYKGAVDHPDFVDTADKLHRREIFLAACAPANIAGFQIETEPQTPKIDYKRR